MSSPIPLSTPPEHRSTSEWWSVDGVSLHQFGWSVATIGGSRYDLPPRRGNNIQYPYRPGTRHKQKYPDERVISLVMWLTATEPGTGRPDGDPTLRWNDSWDFLRRLVWKSNGRQVTLTRRWWLTVDGQRTLVTASAQAEIVDTMEPSMTGRHRADFAMQFVLASPYFYGNWIETTIPLNEDVSIINPGHDISATDNLVVELHGGLDNAYLTNLTPDPDIWVRYSPGYISPGRAVILDVPNYLATVEDDGTNVIGNISHSGARSWMVLGPGGNLLRLTAKAGSTGYAVVRFRPPYT